MILRPFIILIASMNEDIFVLSKLSLELAAFEPIFAFKWFKPDFKSSNLLFKLIELSQTFMISYFVILLGILVVFK